MNPTAKLVFSSNSLPVFRDRSDGIWRRLIVIPFEVTIPADKQDPGLTGKLKDELPGIFIWAIKGLQRLQRDRKFTPSVRCEAAKNQHQADCDPVATFLEEQVADDPNGTVSCAQLYSRYQKWCEDHGFKPLNDVNFGKSLKQRKSAVQKRLVRTLPASGGMPQKRTKEYTGILLMPEN